MILVEIQPFLLVFEQDYGEVCSFDPWTNNDDGCI